MTTLTRVSWREHNHADQHRDHDSEGEAMAHADELARRGVVAVVYSIEVGD